MRQVNGVGGGGTSSFFSPAFTDDRSRAALGRLFGGLSGAFGGVAVAADGSNISPQALALLNLKLPTGQYAIPTPQTFNPAQPFALRGFSAFSAPATFDEDQYIINLDYLQTSKSRFGVRAFIADSDQTSPFPGTNIGGAPAPGFPQIVKDEIRNYSLSHTYVFSPTLLNQADFGFYRLIIQTIQAQAFKYTDVGVKASGAANEFPALNVVGSLSLGGNGQGVIVPQNNYTFQDSLTWIRGQHSFRFGGGLTHSQLGVKNFHYLGGLIFQSWPDFLLGLPGGPVASGGNGTPLSNVLVSVDLPGLLDRDWRLTDGNLYAQDDIKLTQSFTVNLGIRYERFDNLADKLGRNSGFDIALANANPPAGGTLAGFLVSENFPGTVPAGVTQLGNRKGILGEHENTISPRIGFAWRLPHSKLAVTDHMVLRGGYGIYYSRATGQPFLQLVAGPPFALIRQQVLTGSFADPFGPDLTFPQFPAYSPTTGRSIMYVDPHYRAPKTQQFGLNLQTDLTHDFLLEVGYVGARGTHQIFAHSQNQALLASPSNPIRGQTTNTTANVALRVPIQGFTAVGLNDIDSPADSWYHGLEASLTKRFSKGLQFLAAYTFSHAYSNSGQNTVAGGTGVNGDQNNFDANYGRADFNREHRFVFSYLYQLPSPRGFNSFFNGLLGGWGVAGVTTIQSGLPLTLTGTNANNIFGITSDRAQLATGCRYQDLKRKGSTISNLNSYFNPGCILRNAAGAASWTIIGDDGRATAFGSSGVGIVEGPGQNNTDLVIIKRTSLSKLREGANVEFRTEFFNAFNHPQFGNPSTNVSSAAFGVISTTSVNPRIIQFGLKVNF